MTLQIAADTVPLYLAEEGRIIRIEGTRVSLDSILSSHLRGEAPEEIAAAFPTVGLANVHAVIAYYLHHRREIIEYLIEGALPPNEVRERWEAHPDYQAHMQRLVAERDAAARERH